MKSTAFSQKEQLNFEQYCQTAQIIISYFLGDPLNKEESTKLDEWLNSDSSNRQFLEKLDKEDWLETTIGDFRALPAKESFGKTMLLINQDNI